MWDHKGARKGMLKDHKDLIGPVYIFDGTMLFTMKKLQHKVTELARSSPLYGRRVLRLT